MVEEGSFRGFILDSEPNIAYDNWLSHLVEGLAVAGGHNDHLPVELDPQTNGFGNFELIPEEDADSARAVWREMFNALWNDQPGVIEDLIVETGISYELVYFLDTDTDREFRMLRETLDSTYVDTGYYEGEDDDVIGSFNHGWGVFVYSPEAASPNVNINCPHPNDDYISVPIALEMFLDADLGTFAANGSGREVMWNEGEDFRNSQSISDPSRNPDLPFHWFVEFFIDTVRADEMLDMTIQVHSYDSGLHINRAPVMISPGGDDPFPNRPLRDLSSSHLDWINFTPTIPVPEHYCLPAQEAVHIEDYYAVWHGYDLVHEESGVTIPTNVDLPGYSRNKQMQAASEGRKNFESFDSFVHIEFDELPQELEDAHYNQLYLYSGTIPPTAVNWEPILRYYESSIDGLTAWFENLRNVEDTEPPIGPDSLVVQYASDDYIDLEWLVPADDPNFYTHEIYYDTTQVIDLDSPVWSRDHMSNLCGQNTTITRMPDLQPGWNYGFRIRGVDYAGNTSELTDMVRAVALDTTLPEYLPSFPITSFPTGAWPPFVYGEALSREPLRWILIECLLDGEPQLFVPLGEDEIWQENRWTEYSGYFFEPAGGVPAGTNVQYRIRIEEESFTPHVVYDPPIGYHEFTVTPGDNIFNQNLQFNDGGLVPDGAGGGWTWGAVEEGPGESYDGTHAWSIFEYDRGIEYTLDLPGPFHFAGFETVYLIFEHWYRTALEEGAENRCLDGGVVQYSYDGGETWYNSPPMGYYPKTFADGPYEFYGGFGGESNGWRRAVFNLSQAVDDPQVEIRLLYYGSPVENPSIGWVIDNIRITSFTPTLSEVENVRISSVGDNSAIRINWDRNGADFYRVYRGPDPYQEMELIRETTGNLVIDDEAFQQPYDNICYRVVAVLR